MSNEKLGNGLNHTLGISVLKIYPIKKGIAMFVDFFKIAGGNYRDVLTYIFHEMENVMNKN